MEGTPKSFPPPPPPRGGQTMVSQQPQQMQQPQPYYPQPYYPPPVKRRPPETKWIWIGVIGIIIVMIGAIIASIGQATPAPNPWNYYDKSGNFDEMGYKQDYNAWVNNTRSTILAGKMLSVIGDILIGIMAIGVMMDSKIPEDKRKTLLLISVILFGLVLIATLVMTGNLTYFPSYSYGYGH